MLKFVISIALVFVFVLAKDAYAYIDPGTGGAIYQMLIVFIGVIVGYFTVFKRYIQGMFMKGNDDDNDEKKDDGQDESDS